MVKLGIGKSETHGLLPDPEPRELKYTFISVDDHLVEPRDTFEGRLERKFQAHAPKVVETEEGHEVWEWEGKLYHQVGLTATAGRPREDWLPEPVRFDEIRPGCYQIDERIKDMDINGTWASMNFPSMVTGFAGSLFSNAADPALGLALVRAFNDWHFEVWHSPYPDRIIPMGITYLADAELGAQEIRRNAKRGFRSVTLPERPHLLGLPSIFSGHWDPIVAACAETETVISLHIGSSGPTPGGAKDSPGLVLGATLFGQQALASCVEWFWSQYALKHPNLEIAMSEGGIGWVAMLIDRLDNMMDRSGYGHAWPDKDLRPSDCLRRNFWFCSLDDPSTLSTRHAIGVENILLESDYPHGDSTWPDTQRVIERFYGGFPVEEIRMMTHQNAAKLYRVPLPEVCVP